MTLRPFRGDQSFERRKERRTIAMRLYRRGSTTSGSSDENDFHRFEVNRKRSGRSVTREEEANFFLAYAKRELNDEKYDKLMDLITGFQFRSKSTDDVLSQAEDLLEGDKFLFLGFDYFLHKRYKIDPSLEIGYNVNPIALLMVKEEAEKLVDKIEKELEGDVSTRNRFLDALNSDHPGETLRKLGVIFKNKEYILNHFDYFSQNPTAYLEQHKGSRETLHKYQKSFHPSSQSGNKAEKLLGDLQLMKKGGRGKSTPSSPSSAEPSSVEGNKDEESNDISELDRSTYPRISPGYCLLPKDQVPEIKKPEDKYLNRHCISVASLDRNTYFISMHHNKYAKKLFKYEDARFELDVFISSTESAFERAEKRLAWFGGKAAETGDPDPLSAKDLRLIEGMYDDQGLEMVEILHNNEAKALPQILKRLKQKKMEWKEKRSEFNKEWTKVVAENHYKALDHSHCCLRR